MAITPTYSWPLPDDTDLVKDGAEAIRDLGNAIDTTVGGLSSGGLVHIDTVTVGSGVSSVSLNDVFSATYDNYLINGYVKQTSGTADFFLRLRNAGSDRTAAAYRVQLLHLFSASNGNGKYVSSIFDLGTTDDAGGCGFSATIFSPAVSSTTFFVGGGGNEGNLKHEAGVYNVVDTNDGFSVLVSAGTLASGYISVYGLVK